eukprot:tig00000691_g3168.t1
MYVDRSGELAECVQARRKTKGDKRPASEILRSRRRTLFVSFSQDVMKKVDLAGECVQGYEREVQQARQAALKSLAFATAQEKARREQELDALENDTRALLGQCMQLIEKLKGNVEVLGNELEEGMAEAAGAKPRKASKPVPMNPTALAHRYGVVMYIHERLQALTRSFERARAARLEAIASSSRRRHATRGEESAAVWKALGAGGAEKGGAAAAAAEVAAAEEEARRAREFEASLSAEQRRELQEENVRLFHDFTSLNDQVREAERKVTDIARLQRLFGAEVARQAGDIERLYEEAVATCEDLGRGNRELKKASERGALDLRAIVVFFILVMSFALLFLDWYNG